MLDKLTVYECVKGELESKLSNLQHQFDELKQSLSSETKSTAGDKHETGRAMAQLEQEKLSAQLDQVKLLKEALSKVNPSEIHNTIQYGSLVNTSIGYFFLSIGLGKISISNTEVFCMTATSPLGKQLIGKRQGDVIQLNQRIEILNIN